MLYLLAGVNLVLLVLLLYFLIKGSFGKPKNASDEALRDLERRLTDLFMNSLNNVRSSFDGNSQIMHNEIHRFTEETTSIKEQLRQMSETVKKVVDFQDIFKTPKLYGQWGESSLESILAQYYPKEMYERQHYFKSGEAVDFVLKLPDEKLLPIDSKFPRETFMAMINAKDEKEKEAARLAFINDVKKAIDDISHKYILPAENTVDLAIMYIPAEAVYYEIVHHLPTETNVDLIDYAQKRKVVLTSPNLLYLTLNTIEQWLLDSQISRQTKEIIKRLSRIRQDALKLSDNFRKLGKHLDDAHSAYEESDKRLSLITNRVTSLIESEGDKEAELEPPED